MTTEHVFERTQGHKGPFHVAGFHVAKYQACHGAPVQPGASCDHCGTAIMNVYTIRAADGYTFKVGCDCVAKTGDAGLIREVKAAQAERRAEMRAARALAREEGRAAKARTEADAFLAARPELATAFAECTHEIVVDMARKLKKYGSLSSAQIDLALRLWSEQAIGVFNPAEPPAVPVPLEARNGRVTLEGVILGTKLQESMYGETLKMLLQVRTPDGAWKAWSTVPRGLYCPSSGLRGLRVVVKARVEVSKDDACFAFLNRPTAVSPTTP